MRRICTGGSPPIRVLTVGRKQFSKALLEQLPERSCLDWLHAVSIADGGEYEGEFDLSTCVTGDVWGWVKGGYEAPNDWSRDFGTYRWILFEADGRLFRHRDYDRPPVSGHWSSQLLRLAQSLHHRRHTLPGWGRDDQLFMGI